MSERRDSDKMSPSQKDEFRKQITNSNFDVRQASIIPRPTTRSLLRLVGSTPFTR